MLIRVLIMVLGTTLLFTNPVDVHARKKRKVYKKRAIVTKPKKFIHQEGGFSIQFPGSHGQIKGDTSTIATTFGSTEFYAYVSNGAQSASMIAFYELDTKKIQEKDTLLAQNSKLLLDTLQQQLITNLGGTIQRKVKIVREGLYHSRIAYFSAKGEGGKSVFFKCENIYVPPRVYQLIYQSSNKNATDQAEAKKFFQSFSLKKK